MAMAPEQIGIGIRRYFTEAGVHPYDTVAWERRDARIQNYKDGTDAFFQPDVEFPVHWSQNATNIVAQKYFRGTLGTAERETSLKQVIDRVADTITAWGVRDGYFVDDDEAAAFRNELKFILVHQRAAFNSPVWFNIGVQGVPQQASACFILAVDDTMDGILNWYREEGVIFKGGSGAGTNLSNIRSSFEHLAGGGTASGPVSFMRGADASAGTIKSGGKTRRAAKMVILDVDHPDVEEFVWCKAREERKARVLRDAGFDMDLDGIDSHSTQYQNANNSVRVTDEFMQAVVEDRDWDFTAVTTGETIRTVKARDLMRQIAEAAWECADPGMQYDTTINRWHTAPVTGRINASNPCSEYMHLDNSACNLASINLLHYLADDGTVDVEAFRHTVEVVFTAQEILVGNADYPTENIGETSRAFRQLGLGYANLGALLMAQGLPYDSDEGRAWAAAITSLMTGHAYTTSARTAGRMGPFARYAENADAMLDVLRMHRAAAAEIDEELVPADLLSAAQRSWDEAVEVGEVHGVRNSQASVLAPTGTIGLMMDCDTTGIEPDLALTKAKKLVGGGTMLIVNQTIPRALRNLRYSDAQVNAIVAYINEHKTIIGAPDFDPEHLPVFACSMGDNPIDYMGHVKMMATVQPFISGAISKCVRGDTLLTTSDGLVRIGTLHRGEAPHSFRDEVIEVASIEGPQKTDAFYYGGSRRVREVVLRSGHRVVATPNHRLLTAGAGGPEWIATEDIRPGEYVAVQYGADMWSTVPARFDDFVATARNQGDQRVTLPTEMSAELAFLLGAYAVAGHTTRSNATVTISSSVDAVLERVADAWRTLFAVESRIVRPVHRCASVVVTSKEIVELLEFLECGARASEKRIPDAVLRSPREMVLAFLQGLAIDAYVSTTTTPKWAIDGESTALLDDLQAVLTNLGIVHGRTTKHNEEYDEVLGEVSVTGRHAQRLSELVPFLEPEKAARAAVLQGLGIDADGDTADVVLDNLHFSPVESVHDAGLTEVFDVSVPTTHAFVGNGIVNHNTVNMPEDVSVEDVEDLYLESWRLGLKAVAIYRDNCKVAQPLSTQKKSGDEKADAVGAEVERIVETVIVQQPVRQKLPRTRTSKTFSFRVADCHGYATVGEFEDGRPGEVFLKVAKQGSTLAGIMDAFAISVSHGLQYGVPLRAFVDMFTNMRFEPAGMTDDPDIRFATSLVDYIFRRMAVEYLTMEERHEMGILTVGERMQPTLPGVEEQVIESSPGFDLLPPEDRAPSAGRSASTPPAAAPEPRVEGEMVLCYVCGDIMQRAGSCHACPSCGATSGCS